jgi:hypothetical protein
MTLGKSVIAMSLKVSEMSSNHTLVSLCLVPLYSTPLFLTIELLREWQNSGAPKKAFVNLRKSHYLSTT